MGKKKTITGQAFSNRKWMYFTGNQKPLEVNPPAKAEDKPREGLDIYIISQNFNLFVKNHFNYE